MTIKKMENLHVSADYSDLMTCRSNKEVNMNSADNDNNDSCFSNDAFFKMQNLKHESIRARKTV